MGTSINRSKIFYDDVKVFHEKTMDIVEILRNFKRTVGKEVKLNYKYGSVRLEDNKVIENDFNITNEYIQVINEWGNDKENNTLKIKDKILKLELNNNKIFLFKVFDDFGTKNNFVLSGYIVSVSVELRLFLAEIAGAELKEAAKQFISIL